MAEQTFEPHLLVAEGVLLLIAASAMWPLSRLLRPRQSPLVVGGYYSVDGSEGASYRIAKVLAVDDAAIHIRLYRNEFAQRPTTVDLAALDLGSVDDPNGFGIGHLPLSRDTFATWEPAYLHVQATVTDEELLGYDIWRDSEGGLL